MAAAAVAAVAAATSLFPIVGGAGALARQVRPSHNAIQRPGWSRRKSFRRAESSRYTTPRMALCHASLSGSLLSHIE